MVQISAGMIAKEGLVTGLLDNLVTVVFSGRPLAVGEVVELSKAVLMVWMPGIEGGNAIDDVLYGDVVLEGRLSISLLRSVGSDTKNRATFQLV